MSMALSVRTSRPDRPGCCADASSNTPTWVPGLGISAYGTPSTVASPAVGRVRSDEAGHDARLHGERDPVHRGLYAVALRESIDLDHGSIVLGWPARYIRRSE